jgi:hypothetical protein
MIPKGLPDFIQRLKNAETALTAYRARHEQLLNDCSENEEAEPLDYLPGLMWVQQDLTVTFKAIGFVKDNVQQDLTVTFKDSPKT